MKPSNSHSHITSRRRVDSRLALTLITLTLCWGAAVGAEEGAAKPAVVAPSVGATDPQNPPGVAVAAAPSAGGEAANRSPLGTLSRGVAEIVKMADAGVTTAVIKTYVECSPTPYQLTDADIIALKRHNVADEIVTVLLKQGAQVRALAAQKRNDAAARAQATSNARFGGMDPESYDYFQYYYLHPRTLASAYQRLSPYAGPWSGYPYGPSPAFGFSPYRMRPF